MEKSPTIIEIAKSLVNFQREMKPVVFDANNPFFKSKYATLSALVHHATPLLVKNGLAVSQLTENEGSITTILMHISGEFLSSTLTLKPVKDDPQGRGSCLTYSRRYAYAAILGLTANEDDDGNFASQPTKSKKEASQISPPEGCKSMKEYMMELATSMFKDMDEFKVWRTENDVPEDMEGWKELEYAVVFNKLKSIKTKLSKEKK